MHVRILIANYKVDFVVTTHVMQKCTYNNIGFKYENKMVGEVRVKVVIKARQK
jgi:hypothetical protein